MFSLLFNANPEDNEDIDEEDNDGELEENPDKSEPKSNQVRATWYSFGWGNIAINCTAFTFRLELRMSPRALAQLPWMMRVDLIFKRRIFPLEQIKMNLRAQWFNDQLLSQWPMYESSSSGLVFGFLFLRNAHYDPFKCNLVK